jgi:hypothetical protein
MADTTFAQFTLEASPVVTDFLVGYRTNISGGERRTTLSSLNTLFQANITSGLTANRVLLAGASGALTASDLSYSTPTLSVPDAFVVSSAGSIGLTAGGSNKNITITPSGTGYVFSQGDIRIDKTSADAELRVTANAGQTRMVSFNTAGGGRRWIYYTDGATESGSNAGSDFHIARYSDAGTIIDAPFNVKRSTGNIMIRTTTDGGGVFQISPSSGISANAWGVSGAMMRVGAQTFTDSSSSGTVATAVANSFAVPTFAASSATTFTNAANLYIAGDVANGSNVTLTNSYGLWNVGKTRNGGAVIGDVQALSGAGAINVTQPNTDFTSTGGAQALTLANGIVGQIKTIVHVVDGGSGVLTPTTKVGFSTITFTNAGDSVTLRYSASGWAIVGIFGAVAA